MIELLFKCKIVATIYSVPVLDVLHVHVCEPVVQLLDEVEELRLGASQEKKQRVRVERQLRELEEEMVIVKVHMYM